MVVPALAVTSLAAASGLSSGLRGLCDHRLMTTARIKSVFEEAGCTGQLCVQNLDGSEEVALDADRAVVSASVVKVSIALTAEMAPTTRR